MLTVRLFGGLADQAGTGRVEVELAEGMTAGSLLDALARAHPQLARGLRSAKVAVNLEIADAEQPLSASDEVAVLPPVAGGSVDADGGDGRDTVILTGLRAGGLDPNEALAAVASPSAGATALFLGTVRDHSAQLDAVERLEYSAYEQMAERSLRILAEEVVGRWPPLLGIALLHAVGELPPGAPTIVVACSAPHRDEAFSACRHLLEETKARVPVWKREIGANGSRWVGFEGC